MASNVGGRIQNAGADENTEALKKEIDYQSEFKSMKGIARRWLDPDEVRCERLNLKY